MGPKITVKEGVKLDGLHAVMWGIVPLVAGVFEAEGLECAITSALREPTPKKSRHPQGLALDFRGKHVPPNIRTMIEMRIKERVGHNFDVIAHGVGDHFHYHVEWDPKR